MKVFTYIIFSKSTISYYAGITNNLKNRLKEHNNAKTRFTSKAYDWEIVYLKQFESRTEAYIHEKQIKQTGPKRFIENLK